MQDVLGLGVYWLAVTGVLAAIGLWLFITGRVMFALPALTYACLIKPQLAALMPLLAYRFSTRLDGKYTVPPSE